MRTEQNNFKLKPLKSDTHGFIEHEIYGEYYHLVFRNPHLSYDQLIKEKDKALLETYIAQQVEWIKVKLSDEIIHNFLRISLINRDQPIHYLFLQIVPTGVQFLLRSDPTNLKLMID